MMAPSIEGTYQLVRRELPDGTAQLPPAVRGMITYTKEFRKEGGRLAPPTPTGCVVTRRNHE